MTLNTLLKRPYFTDTSARYRLKHAAFFGLFVFIFLFVFRPFGLGSLSGILLIVCAGFGFVTFAAMVILNVFITHLFKKFYKEEDWTLGKEMFQTILNIILIGCFNFLFFSFLISNNFSWKAFLWFQFSAFAVGAIPVSIYLILKEKSSRIRFETEAQQLSGKIEKNRNKAEVYNPVTFYSQKSKENFTIKPDLLFYIQASDNYLDIFFGNGTLQRKTIRNTLKSAQDKLNDYPVFMRCHRSYIVNIEKIIRITGNAQGYKLHLQGIEEPIPVSRQYNNLIKDRLTNRP